MSTQERLPEMGLVKHPDLTDLAQKYKEAQTRRLTALREEKVHKDALMMLMKQKGLEIYEDPDDDVLIEIEQEETISVKVGKQAQATSEAA